MGIFIPAEQYIKLKVDPIKPRPWQAGYTRQWSRQDELKYGITKAAFTRLMSRQGGKCAICRHSQAVFIDHCHQTGKVRGILCLDCNTGIGKFNDDPEQIRAALDYLGLGFSG